MAEKLGILSFFKNGQVGPAPDAVKSVSEKIKKQKDKKKKKKKTLLSTDKDDE